MNSIEEIQSEIIENFNLFDDDLESKLFYLMELGSKLEHIEEADRVEENLVKGCMSKVWLVANFSDEKIFFKADSNTEVTKGLVALLIKIWNGKTPDEILNSELTFIDKIGMSRLIGTQRSSGFASMIKQMKLYALAYKTKGQQ